MQKRKLGNSGLELTTVGLGTWAIGGAGWRASWGRQDDSESIAAIHRAIELGVNWIDTAAVYGLGHSEEMVGEAIRGHRHEVLVATKCGQAWGEDRQIVRTLKADSLQRVKWKAACADWESKRSICTRFTGRYPMKNWKKPGIQWRNS